MIFKSSTFALILKYSRYYKFWIDYVYSLVEAFESLWKIFVYDSGELSVLW